MSIEADDHLRRGSIPYSDRAVRMTHSEEVRLNSALGDAGDLTLVVLILPSRQQLALLHIPTQHLLVCANIRSACAGASTRGSGEAVWCPQTVGRRRADRPECLSGFVLPAIISMSCCLLSLQRRPLTYTSEPSLRRTFMCIATFCMRSPTLFSGRDGNVRALLNRLTLVQLQSILKVNPDQPRQLCGSCRLPRAVTSLSLIHI